MRITSCLRYPCGQLHKIRVPELPSNKLRFRVPLIQEEELQNSQESEFGELLSNYTTQRIRVPLLWFVGSLDFMLLAAGAKILYRRPQEDKILHVLAPSTRQFIFWGGHQRFLLAKQHVWERFCESAFKFWIGQNQNDRKSQGALGTAPLNIGADVY